jgi:diguanylate cyclase (GGDEF)-like protein
MVDELNLQRHFNRLSSSVLRFQFGRCLRLSPCISPIRKARAALQLASYYVFSREPLRRARLARSLLAIQLYIGGDWLGQFGLAHWHSSLQGVRSYQGISTVVSLVTFALLRSGWSESFADPSLSIYQIMVAQTLAALCYVVFPPVRGALLILQIVVISFSLFSLRNRGQVLVSVYPLCLMAGTIGTATWLNPLVFAPDIELVHFVILAAVLPSVSVLGSQFTKMRIRLKQQAAELETAVARIQDLAGRDELTGLHNRRFILDIIRHHVQLHERSGKLFCIAMLDIDHFKSVNDTHGHQNGDAVLRQFGGSAQRTLRQTDVIARWGGEEFLVLLSDSQIAHASTAIERLRAMLSTFEILHVEPDFRVKFSAGVTQFASGDQLEAVIERADKALYLAKQRGRDCTVAI